MGAKKGLLLVGIKRRKKRRVKRDLMVSSELQVFLVPFLSLQFLLFCTDVSSRYANAKHTPLLPPSIHASALIPEHSRSSIREN